MYRLVYVKPPKNISPRMSTPFFDSDREIAHVFHVPLRRPHLSLFFWQLIFRQSRCFLKMWPTLDQIFRRKRRKNPEIWPRDWHVRCRARVQNFRVYLSRTAWTLRLLCVKMIKIRYSLRITWFQSSIQFFRQILLNVGHRQVRFYVSHETFYRHALEYLQPVRAK